MVLLCCWSLYLKDSKNWTELRDFKLLDGCSWPWKLTLRRAGFMCFVWLDVCVCMCVCMKDYSWKRHDSSFWTIHHQVVDSHLSIICWQTSWHPVDTQGPTLYDYQRPCDRCLPFPLTQLCSVSGMMEGENFIMFRVSPLFYAEFVRFLCTVWRIVTQMKWRFKRVTLAQSSVHSPALECPLPDRGYKR